jgi:hypothetical protein
MASLIAIPFLIGSVPLGLAVFGANHFLKDKKKTNKFLYWGGITASAFGGWVVSNMLMTRYVESEVLSAEQKFKEPYMKGDKIDMKRGNDGKFRRRLVVPLEKNADTTPPPKRYFYRWIGGSSGNPIFFGYPDAPKFYYHNTIVHYVHPIYDEEYVKTLVHNLNKISNK